MKLETPQQAELGEVRLPQVVGRPLIHLIEPLDPDLSVALAKSDLDNYYRHCRRFDGLRTWRLARRKGPVLFSGTIELINLSPWDSTWVRDVVVHLSKDLRLRYQIRFLF